VLDRPVLPLVSRMQGPRQRAGQASDGGATASGPSRPRCMLVGHRTAISRNARLNEQPGQVSWPGCLGRFGVTMGVAPAISECWHSNRDPAGGSRAADRLHRMSTREPEDARSRVLRPELSRQQQYAPWVHREGGGGWTASQLDGSFWTTDGMTQGTTLRCGLRPDLSELLVFGMALPA
jgi:hypothetical protein